jgi:hypothetical protein
MKRSAMRVKSARTVIIISGITGLRSGIISGIKALQFYQGDWDEI